MARGQRSVEREKLWRGVLARFSKSQLSIRAFCTRERLSEPAFYFWRRTLAERDAATRSAPRAPSARRKRKQPAFLPVVMRPEPPTPPTPGISLELRGGRTLWLPESMPVERLAELIAAIEAAETLTAVRALKTSVQMTATSHSSNRSPSRFIIKKRGTARIVTNNSS